MARIPQRGHKDDNHDLLANALRQQGWFVLDTHEVGGGFFDFIACKGRTVFVEVKDGSKAPSRRRLRDSQVKLHADFRRAGAEVVVIETLADLQQFDRPFTGWYDAKQMGMK